MLFRSCQPGAGEPRAQSNTLVVRCIVVALVANAMATAFAKPPLPTPSTPPKQTPQQHLRFTEQEYSWGKVLQGETIKHAFQFFNDSDEVIEIFEIKPSCGCADVQFDKTIAARASGTITVTIDTGQLLGPSQLKWVTGKTRNPGAPQAPAGEFQIWIKGDVDPIFIVEPNSLYVVVYPGQAALHSVVLTPATSLDFELLSVVAKDARLTVKTTEELPGKRYRLELSAPAFERPDAIKEMLLVELRTSDGKTRKTQLRALVECKARWACEPTYVSYTADETRALNAPGAAPLTKNLEVFANAPDYKFKLLSARVTSAPPDSLATEIVTIEDGRRYQVRVSLQKDVKARTARFQILIETDDTLTPQQAVTVIAYSDGATQ
ncbi:MAG: DUF1573 domain-containing protein [Planctomycetota bacterium]